MLPEPRRRGNADGLVDEQFVSRARNDVAEDPRKPRPVEDHRHPRSGPSSANAHVQHARRRIDSRDDAHAQDVRETDARAPSRQVAEREAFALAPDEYSPDALDAKTGERVSEADRGASPRDAAGDAEVAVKVIVARVTPEVAELTPDGRCRQAERDRGVTVDDAGVGRTDLQRAVPSAMPSFGSRVSASAFSAMPSRTWLCSR